MVVSLIDLLSLKHKYLMHNSLNVKKRNDHWRNLSCFLGVWWDICEALFTLPFCFWIIKTKFVTCETKTELNFEFNLKQKQVHLRWESKIMHFHLWLLLSCMYSRPSSMQIIKSNTHQLLPTTNFLALHTIFQILQVLIQLLSRIFCLLLINL